MSTEVTSQWMNLSNMRVDRALTYDSHTDLILSREINRSVWLGVRSRRRGGSEPGHSGSLPFLSGSRRERRLVRESFMASRPWTWGPYIAATRGAAPQAEIFFDKFHVIENYLNVIDRVRIDECGRAKEEGKGCPHHPH